METEGKVLTVMGDDVDTDIIYPARYLSLFDEKEVAKHLFEDIDPGFIQRARAGGIIWAGKSFGCGSAREQAATALKHVGIQLVIARSFSRSFYRNAINNGLPLLEIIGEGDVKWADEGDLLMVNVDRGFVVNTATGRTCRCIPPAAFIVEVLQMGGICNYYLKNKGREMAEGVCSQ